MGVFNERIGSPKGNERRCGGPSNSACAPRAVTYERWTAGQPGVPRPSVMLCACLLACCAPSGPAGVPASPAMVASTPAGTVSGQVIGVTDGDTLSVLVDGRPIKVRLAGIDAPEKRQPFGTVAKTALSALVFGQPVTLQPSGKDRYGRTIADVFQAGRWVFVKDPSDGRLIDAEAAARAARRGLWVDPAPVAPWEWRKG